VRGLLSSVQAHLRDLVEMMAERGVSMAHTTIMRWVQRYAPEFEKTLAPVCRAVGQSWRVDETYVKIRGEWQIAPVRSCLARHSNETCALRLPGPRHSSRSNRPARVEPPAFVIAGGQSLMPVLAFRLATPSLLVDLRRLPGLGNIAVGDDV